MEYTDNILKEEWNIHTLAYSEEWNIQTLSIGSNGIIYRAAKL